MPKSPNGSVHLPTQSEYEVFLQGFIHGWTPHSSLMLTSASIVVFILAMLVAFCRRGPREISVEDYVRVGFAAGPLPVYFLLPLAPFDQDLSAVLFDQSAQLFIAAVIGLVWTVADIKKIVGARPKAKTKPRTPKA